MSTFDVPRLTRVDEGYRPFPNQEWRNLLQTRVEIPLMVRLLHVPQAQRLLEVGCGRGVGLLALSRSCRPAALVGIDLALELVDEAHERMRRAETVALIEAGDVRDLPFASESIDVVIDFGTCYHIAHPEQGLAEIERVLRPGGLFVYESPFSQALAHPIRTRGRRLPWSAAPGLRVKRRAGLWSSREKVD